MTEQEKSNSDKHEDINSEFESNNTNADTVNKNIDLKSQVETIIKEKDQRIEALEKELQIVRKNESEAMIRARAEIDNIRKRVEQDIEKANKFALEKFSSELLPVIDNLERALDATNKENTEHNATVEGLELTLKSFLDTVKKFGVDVVPDNGGQLNPEVHQAITMVDSPDHKSGQIVNTIQKGYTLNGRLIRPAMVIVAK